MAKKVVPPSSPPLGKTLSSDATRQGHNTFISFSLPSFIGVLCIPLVIGLFAGSLLSTHLSLKPIQSAQKQDVSLQPLAQQQTQSQPLEPSATSQMVAAQSRLEKDVLQNPGNRPFWVELGNIYFDTGQYTKAINAYTQALDLKRDDPDVLTDLGIMYRAIHEHEKAVAAFDEALSIDPNHVNALFNKGIVCGYDLNNTAEARKAWEKLLSLKPDARDSNRRSVRDLLQQMR